MKQKINHIKLIQTVLDNGGALVGGYVREWVRYGNPQDTGWNDIDVFCKNKKNIKIIDEKLRDFGVNCDFRASSPFNDFFCNCWMFDGKIKPVESVDKTFSEKEILDQTKNSKARMMNCCFPRKDKIINFLNNGWEIIFPNGCIPSKDWMDCFLNNYSISATNFNFAKTKTLMV